MLANKLIASSNSVSLPGEFSVSSSSIVFNSNASSVLVPYAPSIQAGDLLFLQGLVQDAVSYGEFAEPGTWTSLVDSGSYATSLYTTANGSESGSVELNFGTNESSVTNMLSIRYSKPATIKIRMVDDFWVVNPVLSLGAPPEAYTKAIHLIVYVDNGSLSVTGLDSSLNFLQYRTTSYGMYVGWIDSSNLSRVGTTVSANSNGNTITARSFVVYV